MKLRTNKMRGKFVYLKNRWQIHWWKNERVTKSSYMWGEFETTIPSTNFFAIIFIESIKTLDCNIACIATLITPTLLTTLLLFYIIVLTLYEVINKKQFSYFFEKMFSRFIYFICIIIFSMTSYPDNNIDFWSASI